ncbi:MAG: DNA-processing protein DprA [Sphingomonadales bacterium]|nr:DNA-processing protein DprA [Sphingomonadales bacterium]
MPPMGAETSKTGLKSAERLARVRLARSENIGPITFRQLVRQFGNAVSALDALPDLARRGGRAKSVKIHSKASAEREVTAAETYGAELMVLGDADYPPALAAIEDAPPVLYRKGHAHLLTSRRIAIVGARNASAVGRKFTRQLARDLGEAGLVVVSGLARGIDTAAHEGALATGTIACVAGGMNIPYPKENTELHDAIEEQGLIVSEMPMGTQPKASHFPRRNRIISGLSLGIVVVEAAFRSGSLITARLAGEQGREVFAVPGSPLDPRSKGTNNLIRDGATLVENAADVLDILRDLPRGPIAEPDKRLFDGPPAQPVGEQELARARPAIQESLSPTPVEIDEIIRSTKLPASVVLTVLLELEVAGVAARLPGNRVALI